MAVSAADHYEVRWRVKNADAAWGSPRTCPALDEIVVEELDRTQQYEFEVRAVSNCGAKSIWVSSDYTVPGAVPPTSIDTLTAQSLADGVHLGWTSIATPAAGIESSIERSANGTTGWAERARVRSTAYTDPETSGTTYYYRVRYVNFAGQFGGYSPVVNSNGVNVGSIGTNAANALADAAAAQADADAANAALADIASDGILSPNEKPVVIRDYNVIIAEQAGIDAQAVAYGITTEKTAYDTAVSALTAYLATLTAPVLWSNLTGNTTIVGATFRSKFADVYTTRQALLNAIYAAAKAKADAAQAAAAAAQGTADQGVSLASQMPIVNPNFDATPAGYGWVADSGSGWVTDMTGVTPGGGTGCAKRVGAGGGTYSYRNIGRAPCQPGQVVKFQALIKAISANGYCTPTISFQNSAGAEITSAPGNILVTGTTTIGSFAALAAPAGTVCVVMQLTVSGHTTGTYLCDNTATNMLPASLDEVPDGSVYSKATVLGSTEIVDNPDFEVPGTLIPPPGWLSGGGVTSAYTGAGGTWSGTRSLSLTATSTFGLLYSARTYPCLANEQYSLSAVIACNSGAAGGGNYGALYAQVFDKTGVTLGFYGPSNGFGGGTGFQALQAAFVMPAGAVSFRLDLIVAGAIGDNYFFDNIRMARQRSLSTEVTGTLSTQKNLPSVTFGNYGSGWSGLSLSYTATTTSATVSASAATLQAGGDAISYSASSITLSGATGSVVTYYLYYNDAGMSGGAKTLQATTNQITSLSNNSYVLLGTCKVTYPTSGTGGGGGGVGCPVRTARVMRRVMGGDEEIAAGAVVVGDRLKIINPVTGATRWGLVSMSKPAYVDCVRVVQRGGVELSCSATAPLGGSDGEAVLAPLALGKVITGLDAGAVVRDEVTHVQPIGKCWVQHITCEDDFFLAGDHNGRYLSHHNLKMLPP